MQATLVFLLQEEKFGKLTLYGAFFVHKSTELLENVSPNKGNGIAHKYILNGIACKDIVDSCVLLNLWPYIWL